MRIKLVAIGLFLVLISIPGYLYTPTLVSQIVHSFTSSVTGSIPGTHGGSILHQMGYPSRAVVISLIQYSFVGLALTGVGFLVFGAVAKKISKQITVKMVTEEIEKTIPVSSPQSADERIQTNLRSLRILQERLAKGEITSSEFQNLKKILE